MSNVKHSKSKKNASMVFATACLSVVVVLTVIMITIIMSKYFLNSENPALSGINTSGPSNITDDNTPMSSGSSTSGVPGTPSQENTKAPNVTEKPSTPPATTAPEEDKKDPDYSEELNFTADLSALERYMDPKGEDWDDAYLMLVNVDNPIGKGEEDGYPFLAPRIKFSKSTDYSYKYMRSLYMNEVAMRALSAMFTEAAANGITDLDVTSAYRTYAKQESLFTSYCSKTYKWQCANDGTIWVGRSSACPECGKKSSKKLEVTQEEIEANVATYSCAPGTSDHQTGLAVDVVQTSLPSKFNSLIQEFGETEAGIWLEENCWKFGFVLRFPPDKEDITGIIYEPWHFRFVGRTHAAKMKELDMCLEEYIVYLTQTGYFE